MGDTAYELLAMGLRYVFVLLIVLALLRAGWLMLGDRREYRRTLRQLPDAGLVGEVVNLESGAAQPLPREGLMGAGRSCDIRFSRLHRRELEFMFRPGLGVKLIPLHGKHQAMLDGEPLNKADAFALHGTVLEIRGVSLRFRLFAGLDVPQRAAVPYEVYHEEPQDNPWEGAEPAYTEGSMPYIAPGAPAPESDLNMTWAYMPPVDVPQAPPPLAENTNRNRRTDRGQQFHD